MPGTRRAQSDSENVAGTSTRAQPRLHARPVLVNRRQESNRRNHAAGQRKREAKPALPSPKRHQKLGSARKERVPPPQREQRSLSRKESLAAEKACAEDRSNDKWAASRAAGTSHSAAAAEPKRRAEKRSANSLDEDPNEDHTTQSVPLPKKRNRKPKTRGTSRSRSRSDRRA